MELFEYTHNYADEGMQVSLVLYKAQKAKFLTVLNFHEINVTIYYN